MIGFSNSFLVVLTFKILGGALGMILFVLGWVIFVLLCQDNHNCCNDYYNDYYDYIRIDDNQNKVTYKCKYLKDRITKIKYTF